MNQRDVLDEWLRYAEMDLATAKHVHEMMRPMPVEIICYHCQQSAEKYLKAYLISVAVEPDKTHSLAFLRGKSEEAAPEFSELTKDTSLLDSYATETRYPTKKFDLTASDAKRAILSAEVVKNFILQKIATTNE